jgi:hypothetical protein
MRKTGHNKYRCQLCGAVLDVREATHVRTMIVASSGEPDVRVMLEDGREIHRCAIPGTR